MRTTAIRSTIPAFLMGIFLTVAASSAGAGVNASYIYNLSNFTGVLPFTWVRVVPDPSRDEIYVCNGGSVHVFNETGMEIYRFGEDEQLGYIYDLVVLENGDLLLLTHLYDGSRTALVRCDYRGEVLESRPLTGIPEGWGAFRASRMIFRGEKLYVVDHSSMKVAVLDLNGSFRESIDLAAILKMNDRQVSDSGIGGFNVDDLGNVYFTVPTKFTVYRLSPQGVLESFGKSGGAPGKFGVISGITADRSGTIYVVDTLKCVVLAFDRDFNFLYEFGNRTSRPGGLVAPKEATISGAGKIYVTQQANRGVSVYRVVPN
jgi:sugar lactone lactonase YvrE